MFSKNSQTSNFIKFHTTGAQFFRMDGRRDGQTWRSWQSLYAILRTCLKIQSVPHSEHLLHVPTQYNPVTVTFKHFAANYLPIITPSDCHTEENCTELKSWIAHSLH